jgi:uncharacterized membrane protein YkvA (DUF1232 family)
MTTSPTPEAHVFPYRGQELALNQHWIADEQPPEAGDGLSRASDGNDAEGKCARSPLKTDWKQQVQRLQKEAHTFYLVFKHPLTPWYARLVAAGIAGYLVSPIQLIPNYIPVIGSLDDLLIIFLGAKLLLKITPANVLAECRGLADEAQKRRLGKARSRAAVAASVAIVAVWMLAAITASALIAAYIRH